MSIERNMLPLNMVKAQIDETLAQSEALLDSFDENRSDTGKLTQCVENFKQLQGVFEMINLSGASLLAEVMAKAIELALSQEGEARDLTLSKITSAIVMLVRYLEYVQVSQSGLPELLFHNINELRAVVKEKPLTESHFFKLDLKAFNLKKVEPIVNADPNNKRLRHMYQVGLLGSFKDENLKSNFRMMARALQRLNGQYQDSQGSQLLRICNGAVEAFMEGNIKLSSPRKLILGRIDRQIKKLLEPSAGEYDEAAIVTLIKDCLYIITLAEPNTKLIKSIQEEFSLDKFDLKDSLIEQERELMTGPSAAVIKTVSSALREEVATVKDRLDVMARTGDKLDELKDLAGDLKRIAHTLTMLGLSIASEKLSSYSDSLGESTDFQSKLSELADLLVFVERAISRLEQNNTPLQANKPEMSAEQMLEMDQVAITVITESRKIIAQVQNSLTNFIEHNNENSYLENAVENLHSAWGGISFINIQRAAEQIQQSANFISEKILAAEASNDNENLHTLADALASIDYYLEGIQERKPLGEGALDIAEESLNELGYGTAA